jgi:Gpi18-like mannosyltransferase
MIGVKTLSLKAVKQTTDGILFPASMWLGSRIIIWIAMLLLAPNLPVPSGGVAASFSLDVFDGWDSNHYQIIANSGYVYANGKGNIAFFPLFPLILHFLMNIGLPFEVAGVLINNLAFLGFLYILYFWVQEHQNRSIARWTVAIAAWFPASMFAGVIYTEGLYLLLSTAALRSFDRNKYAQTALWGALATATRPTGIALIPAFILSAWKQRKPPIAYIAAFATATGIVIFSIYCFIQYGDPLAFIQAQKGWRTELGFTWQPWWKMLMQIIIGNYNYKKGYIKDIGHPLVFLVIVGCGCWLWRDRDKLSGAKVDYGFGILFLGLWLLAGDPLINTISVFGSVYLLWRCRQELTPVTFFYGLCGMGLLLVSGGTWSLSRLVYGIVPPIIAFGILLSRHSRWGYMSLGFFAILLFTFSIRFAQELWVG